MLASTMQEQVMDPGRPEIQVLVYGLLGNHKNLEVC